MIDKWVPESMLLETIREMGVRCDHLRHQLAIRSVVMRMGDVDRVMAVIGIRHHPEGGVDVIVHGEPTPEEPPSKNNPVRIPSFDEWYHKRYGYTFDSTCTPGTQITESMMGLSRAMRDYVSHIVNQKRTPRDAG